MNDEILDEIKVDSSVQNAVVAAEEFTSLLPSADEESVSGGQRNNWPDWLQEIDEIYKANRSHVFLLYGNVNDYPDNTGMRGDVNMVLFDRYDQIWLSQRMMEDSRNRNAKMMMQSNGKPSHVTRIAAVYTVNRGLVFATDMSQQRFRAFLQQARPDLKETDFQTSDFGSVLWLLEQYFQVSSRLFLENYRIRTGKSETGAVLMPEVALTLIIQNAEFLFPAGDVGSLAGDRTAIATMLNWARDGSIASRNKIILVAPQTGGLNELLRSGDSRIAAVRVRRPGLEERREWLENFSRHIEKNPVLVRGQKQAAILLDEELDLQSVANATAGMSRRQMEGIFMESWLTAQPVDQTMISRHKQKANEAEFGEVVTIKQPQGTFDLVGGHELLKEYFLDFVLHPLWAGDRKRVTSGVLLSGPPGTGKTFLAECLAAMAKFNFVEVDFSRLFGSLVGETEKKTDQLLAAIEALAPCLVFCDELDSVFSSGRQSYGDSGVQARMFNKVMKWLSSPARIGQVVVIAATNRPDLLDAAFIRAGRFDDILPCLPPGPGDAKGRAAILNAVRKKLNIRLSRELGDTIQTNNTGLGKLLHDSRIWTGAEIERLLKLANSYACRRQERELLAESSGTNLEKRSVLEKLRELSRQAVIRLEDWNRAMNSYLPSSRDVEEQIDLALRFCNNLEFCPAEWRTRLAELREDRSSSGTGYISQAMAG